MDAAPQLVCSGIGEPLRRISISKHSFSNARIRFPKRINRVLAVATEPKPAPSGPPSTTNASSRTPPVNGVVSNGSKPKSPLPNTVNGSSRSPTSKPINGVSTRIGDVSKDIKRVRAQMEENEDLAILMRGLRGQNLKDSQFAEDDVELRLVEVDESSEFLPLVYDPDSISAYWGKRPRAVLTRITQLLSVAGGFLSRLVWDIINKKVKENEVARAIELREIVTSLGPAYIKLGQALSIRPDILSPAAMTELQKLCDKVPSFPDDIAMALIEEELGQPWPNIYSELSSSPIAAASLGQVYKGRLRENGDIVAVKVQRPFVLETVTVDLFVIRNLGLVLRKFPQISIDVVGLVDEWAARFFEELDYVNEGENGTLFAEMMRKDLPQVVVPKTYQKYTSRKVLTTGWVDGEKLSQSTESDVGELVNVGVICYLKQLLDTGFFHADPHPGNMIRTPDGKLAILDFGLVTKLSDDQKYGMIELTQKFGNNEENVAHMREHIKLVVQESGLVDKIKDCGFEAVVGSSGTIKAVEKAALYGYANVSNMLQVGNMVSFGDSKRYWKLSRGELKGVVESLCGGGEAEKIRREKFFKMRSEFIVAGAVLLEEIFEVIGIEEMEISGYSLAEGVIAETLAKVNDYDLNANAKWSSIVRLAMRFNSNKRMRAASQCASIAKEFFECLRKCDELAGNQVAASLDDKDLEYLEASCLLHNIGLSIEKKGYHKHSYSIIMNGGHLQGYSTEEVKLIALLARHHRKKLPNFGHVSFKEFPTEVKKKFRFLCAIIRISVALQQHRRIDFQQMEFSHSYEGFKLACGGVKVQNSPPCILEPLAEDIGDDLRQELEHFKMVFHEELLLLVPSSVSG